MKPASIMGIESLTPGGPIPLYHQLFEALKEKIISGKISTGERLPSEKHFIETLGVSRITVKRAMDELAKSGLVSRKRGRGTIVMTNTDLQFSSGMNDYINNVVRLRKNTKAEILDQETVTPPDNVRKNLKLKDGEKADRIRHRLYSQNEPISLVETYFPAGLTKNLSRTDLLREPVLTLLLKQGIQIAKTEQRIFASAANPEQAELLKTDEGAPLLAIRAIMLTRDGEPIEDIYAWYHPERYQYQMTLSHIDETQIAER